MSGIWCLLYLFYLYHTETTTVLGKLGQKGAVDAYDAIDRVGQFCHFSGWAVLFSLAVGLVSGAVGHCCCLRFMTHLLKRDDYTRDENLGSGISGMGSMGIGLDTAEAHMESLWARYFWAKAAAVVVPMCAVLYLLLRLSVEAHMLAHAVVVKNGLLGGHLGGQPAWMAAPSAPK
jgi:hypothetical protein